MIWGILGIVGLLVSGFLFILMTDGRYFGKALMYRVYDRIGPAIFGSRSEANDWQNLLTHLHLRGDEQVLDVGTAVGDLPLTIAAQADFHGHATGIDWSPRMMDAANAEAEKRGLSARVDFRIVDVRQPLPFDGNSFDVIFCFGLIETLPNPQALLQEFSRLLKPHGILTLSLYKGWLSWSAALDLEWYQTHLADLGRPLQEIQTLPFRNSQDVVVAKFG
ncbi:MAG: class I SAM-dependent methyltransferase [Anaerolineae bacterium]|nr:MAG: class I SAM-dependent methyltransferase [Anaerolineae bacterium]